jgi:hypothetical protein
MLNTVPVSPKEYIASLSDPRQKQVQTLHDFIVKHAPHLKPYIQTAATPLIGYGTYHSVSASGREVDWCLVGLANQKNYISLYFCQVIDGQYLAEKYKAKLPKASVGKSCVRFKKFEDINWPVLQEMLELADRSYHQ